MSKVYFAADESKKTASYLLSRANSWYNELSTNGYLQKLRMMWAAYHGAYYNDFNNSHTITFSGEQGELANISVNHLRNLAQHIIVMITSVRPSLQARSINTDNKSLVQARLANGLLDYYMREKRLEDYLKTAVEYAVVLGSGYIKMEWNAMVGDVYDFNEETGVEVHEGDVQFSNLSPFDVVFDSSREDQQHDWVLCRSFKNRYDILAKYPEFESKILALPSKSDLQSFYVESGLFNETDLIPVYEFYHKRSESMPDGRYLLFLDSDISLLDSPMPYRDLPIYRIAPSNILGTPYGYTPLFDILPIQDAINSLYSTILTNQNAFGVQNILVPKGADINISELSGGLNIVEANEQFGQIRPLQLTATPKEVFDFVGILERAGETLSGVSAVTRGNPDPSLKSGTALALVQSMSLQFMSGLQQSYIMMVENVGTGLINMLRDFAQVPRIAMITGIKNRTNMKEFTGDDLSSINRVIVDIGNPLARTTAGRVEMAEQLLQMGLITDPKQYFQVINTGNLDAMMENSMSEIETIRSENEKLANKEEIIAIATDEHAMHVREHKSVLADPDLRQDPELLKAVLGHIQEHINLLRTTDPDLLAMIKEQPLSPPGGSPANQQMQQPPNSAMQGANPQAMGMPEQGMPGLPSPASPAVPFQNLPTDPANMIPQ
jgi:hypothetical protein